MPAMVTPPEDKDRRSVAKRGRPTPTQVALIDATILAVARSLFLTNGYAITTMEAVASSAGISKRTLYSRYGDKAALFKDVVAERLSTWRAEADDVTFSDAEGLSDQLFHFGTAFLRQMRQPEVSAFHHLIAAEARRFPELANHFYKEGFHGAVVGLSAQIDRALAGSQWPVTGTQSMAQAFLSALLGWFDSQILQGSFSEDDCAAFVSRLVAIFIGGRSAW